MQNVTKEKALDVLGEYRAGDMSRNIITADDVRDVFRDGGPLTLGEFLGALKKRLFAKIKGGD